MTPSALRATVDTRGTPSAGGDACSEGGVRGDAASVNISGLVAEEEGQSSVTLLSAGLKIGRKTLGTTLAFAATTFSNTLSFLFVGHYTDEVSQAAHGFAYSIGNLLCLMVGFGLVAGMDALCPQSIGRRQGWRCWVYLFQAVAVVTFVLVLAAPLLWYSGDILLSTSHEQDPAFALDVQRYLRAAIPGFAALCAFEALRKFLIYNDRIVVQNVISLGCIALQSCSLYFLVGVRNLGCFGAGLARSFTAVSAVLMAAAYIYSIRNQLEWRVFRATHRAKSPSMRERNICPKAHKKISPEASTPSTPPSLASQALRKKASSSTATTIDTGTTLPASTVEKVPTNPVRLVTETSRPAIASCTSASSRRYGSPVGGGAGESPAASGLVGTASGSALRLAACCSSKPVDDDDDSNEREGFKESTSAAAFLLMKAERGRASSVWTGLWAFLRVALPTAMMCASEWISYEAMVVEATALGTSELAALSTAQALASLFFVASAALALQTTSATGRAVGQGNLTEARTNAVAGFIIAALILPLVYAVFMLANPSLTASVFSKSPPVQAVFKRNLPFLAILSAVDCLHVTVAGVLKALKFAWYGALFDFVGLLGVMQLGGMTLAFWAGLKTRGFLLGGIVGVSFSSLAGLLFLCCYGWDKTLRHHKHARVPTYDDKQVVELVGYV